MITLEILQITSGSTYTKCMCYGPFVRYLFSNFMPILKIQTPECVCDFLVFPSLLTPYFTVVPNSLVSWTPLCYSAVATPLTRTPGPACTSEPHGVRISSEPTTPLPRHVHSDTKMHRGALGSMPGSGDTKMNKTLSCTQRTLSKGQMYQQQLPYGWLWGRKWAFLWSQPRIGHHLLSMHHPQILQQTRVLREGTSNMDTWVRLGVRDPRPGAQGLRPVGRVHVLSRSIQCLLLFQMPCLQASFGSGCRCVTSVYYWHII